MKTASPTAQLSHAAIHYELYRNGCRRTRWYQIPWSEVETVLGGPHDGSPEHDASLVAALRAAGSTRIPAEPEGWIDEAGWAIEAQS